MAASTTVYTAGLLWFVAGACRRAQSPATTAASSADAAAAVVVVIAARNESAHIETCLRDLAAQDYPACSYEVILVDDGSTDGTAEIARSVADDLGAEFRFRGLNGPAAYGAGGSKKAALSLAVGSSADSIVLTTDADCRVPSGWIGAMAAQLTPSTGAVVGFSQIGAPGNAGSLLARWEGLDFLQLMTAAAGSCRHGHPMAASGQSLGFRRQAFDEVGGYSSVQHRVSGDDVLLLQLIRGTGRWRIAFCDEPSARIVHPASPGLRSLLSRRARWASNAPLQLRLDPLFFVYMLATFVASLSLLAAPLLWAAGTISGGLVAVLWGAKITAEGALAVVGSKHFGRPDLLRVFPYWALLQPLYTVGVGLTGPLGFFRWKGRRVALGRQGPGNQSKGS